MKHNDGFATIPVTERAPAGATRPTAGCRPGLAHRAGPIAGPAGGGAVPYHWRSRWRQALDDAP